MPGKLIPAKKLAKMETDYVSGVCTSYKELSKKYGVPERTIWKIGRDGGWVAKRKVYCRKVAETAIDARARKDADRLAEAGDAAKNLVTAINEMSGNMDRLCTHLISVQHGPDTDTEERVLSVLNIPYIRGMTQALRDLTEVIARVDRIPTVREQTDRERLELERRRLDAQQNEREQDTTIRVVFEDDLNDEGTDG